MRTALAMGICLLASIVWRWPFASHLAVEPFSWQSVLAAIWPALWCDLLLALGCALLLRLATERSAWLRAGLRLLVIAIWGWTVTACIADYCYFYYSGNHIDGIALQHLQGDAFGMSLDHQTRNYLAFAIGVGALCLLALWLASTRRVSWRHFWSGAIAAAAVVAGGQIATAKTRVGAPPALDLLSTTPPIDIPRLWLALAREAQTPNLELGTLPAQIAHKLRRFGLSYDQDQPYPLVKQHCEHQGLPFAKTGRCDGKPNIIVLFLESFSAALTSVHNSKRFPGLTPHLEDFGRHAHIVEDFFNSSTPTVTALTCTFCSYLPVTNTKTWWLPENGNGETRLRCLPHILREQGYHTAHVHTLNNDFVRTGEALHKIGFVEALDREVIHRELGEPEQSWGFSDHQMFRFLIKRLEGDRHKQPFLLSAATIDSHAPFSPLGDWVSYGDGKNELLNAIHSADHAFGTFFDWFKRSPRFGDTILVVLADHAMFPGKEYLETRKGDDLAGRYYDRILLGIYSPCHRMQGRSRVVSGQIDVTPTILHMLGIDSPNHFEGHSIFGNRQRFPNLVGMHEYLFAIYEKLPHGHRLVNFKLQNRSASVPFNDATGALTQHDFFLFYDWKKSLHANNRIWR